jgi:predicted nuclease of restriction endonuclease-like (RecB) superfamily
MNYYTEIKNALINNEINRKVKNYSINKSDLNTYYNVGKLLSEAGKHYGDGIIKEYSKKLTTELGKGYTQKSLFKYRQFYIIFSKFSTVSRKLTWSHYSELLSLNNKDMINYYIMISETKNLSVRQLREKIKNKEYERLDNNTKLKLINKDEEKITDFIKNPIIIKNKYNTTDISEKMLKKLILDDIPSFLNELGDGFCFIKDEYKIKLGNSNNYIDLLLFNYKFNSFVVIELKVTELKKEHIGQIEIYMNYIDNNLKTINQDKTIGIVICKENNEFIIKYSSDDRILCKEFIFA